MGKTGWQWWRQGKPCGCLVMLVCLLGLVGAFAREVEMEPDGQLLAISGLTGPVTTYGTGQLLTLPSRPGLLPPENSLWESLLLNLAMENNAELQKWTKKQNNLNNILFANVAAQSALSTGQSIPFLAAPTQTLFARQLMSVISSGLSMTGISLQATLARRYSRQIKKLTTQLKLDVNRIVTRLRQGENPEVVRLEVDELVGTQAGREFIELWQSVYERQVPEIEEALPVDIH